MFAEILRKLREVGGLLTDVFAQGTPQFNNPVNLKRVIAMIDEDWSAMDVTGSDKITIVAGHRGNRIAFDSCG